MTTNVRIYHNVGRTPDREYLPMTDGYRAGAPLVLVAEYDDPREPIHAYRLDIAEDAFRIFNVGDDPDITNPPDQRAVEYRERKNRSLSVGDVVGVGEAFLAVADMGFEPVDVRTDQLVQRTEHGTTPLPVPVETMQRHDLGNNESVSTGYAKTEQGYLALTRTESTWLKTEKGAINWLARRGYDATGRRLRGVSDVR